MRRKLKENLERVNDRIAKACAKAGRSQSNVTLVAVTKTAGVDAIQTLLELGVRDIGENRALELVRRAAMVKESLSRRGGDPQGAAQAPRWHMIGHLQRNKVKQLLPWVEVIHSIDSLRLAEEIDLECGKLGRRVRIFLEVNAGNEPQKEGVAFAAASHLAEQVSTLRHVELCGLMAMAPLTADREVIRQVFDRVRELFDEIVKERMAGPSFRELSMGMTNDFELAIEAGATCVRIGSALFEGIDLGPQPADSAEVERPFAM